ncbi:MAG: anti-sigma factor antagonist [Proteobacteria bacterium]|nr:MAG: anti-sigma factor antagonist [Pseudomonadota bacterium]
MEAKFYMTGQVTIVSLSGRLEIEKTYAFKQACLSSLKGKKVVFCMKDLNFVGSTGIQTYFQIIREFSEQNDHRPKIATLNPDFQRLWSYAGSQDIEVHENLGGALSSFQLAGLSIA